MNRCGREKRCGRPGLYIVQENVRRRKNQKKGIQHRGDYLGAGQRALKFLPALFPTHQSRHNLAIWTIKNATKCNKMQRVRDPVVDPPFLLITVRYFGELVQVLVAIGRLQQGAESDGT